MKRKDAIEIELTAEEMQQLAAGTLTLDVRCELDPDAPKRTVLTVRIRFVGEDASNPQRKAGGET